MESHQIVEKYEELEGRVKEIEAELIEVRNEMSRLRAVTGATRDKALSLETALLGNEKLGMTGVVDRLEDFGKELATQRKINFATAGILLLLHVEAAGEILKILGIL